VNWQSCCFHSTLHGLIGIVQATKNLFSICSPGKEADGENGRHTGSRKAKPYVTDSDNARRL